MALELVHLTSADFEEAMDFIDLVFSQAHSPHDFRNLQPTACRPEEEYMHRNLAIKRDGKIRAMVLSSPCEVSVAGNTLKMAGIGNVSTHKYETGSGLMKQLMNQAIAEMQEEGIDFSGLGGQRQRYQYYGYDRCGIKYGYAITARNLKHINYSVPDWHFEPITPDTTEWLNRAKALYEQQPLHCTRGDGSVDTVYRYLSCWHMVPYACLDRAGRMIGYVCASADGTAFSELIADTPAHCVDMAVAWVSMKGVSQVTFGVNAWEVEKCRLLDIICDSCQISPDHQYRIFNWDRVVKAFMDLKASYVPLMDGKLVLEITEWGKLAITVNNGTVCCERTDADADMSMTAFEAGRFIFGPKAAFYAAELPVDKNVLITNWFPLPLSWWHQDCV